jgi:predicted transcriptional regulator
MIFASYISQMTVLSLSPRDRILWILANNGGTMERSRLRASTGMRYAMLNPILEELVKEGRIKIALGKNGDIISLA